MEHRYDVALDDWLRFVYDGASGPGWRSLTELPLTAFDAPVDRERNAKPYGSAVWNHFLSSRYGADGDELQRAAWEVSKGYELPSTRSYDTAIRDTGGEGLSPDFAAFSAATAEWRIPDQGFALASQLPEVERRGTLTTDGAGVAPRMDHLTFALYDVPDTSAARIRLAARFPAGTYGAVALVGREGDGTTGAVTTKLATLPNGGSGGVTLDDPHSFIASGGRITAVLVNADASQRGYGQSDWLWSRDNQAVAAAVTSDLSGPGVTSRTPGPGARRVNPAAQVRVTFSQNVRGVDGNSFSLRDPRGRAVPAAVTYVGASHAAVLVPTTALVDSTRYTVRLTGAIVDDSANSLGASEWSFTTVRQRPRASFTVVSRDGGAVRFLLRSTDRDRLRWSAKLVAGGRTISRRAGTIRPGASRLVSVPAKGRRRARLVIEIRDPQANRRTFARGMHLRR
jgi:hypothetical protein